VNPVFSHAISLDFLGKILVNLLISALVSLTFLLPGRLYRIFREANFVWFISKYFWTFFVFGFFLTSCKSPVVIVTVFALIGILELSQFASLAYFGEFINPYAIGQMFTEAVDVSKTVAGSLRHLNYVIFIVVIPYTLTAVIIGLFDSYELKFPYALVPVLLFLAFPAIRINLHADRKDIISFFPAVTTPTLINTLNSYSIWLTRLLPQSLFPGDKPVFEPVKVSKKAVEEQITVVLIMGESLTCNRMSLFGFERDTTPRLDALKSDPNFFYTKGYSAAVATRATMPVFYNIQYNPLNQDIIKDQPTNLFRLAKEAGFRTLYISAQNANCLNGVSTHFIDHFLTYNSHKDLFDRIHDDGLLELLKTMKLEKRNFIVLHQRCAHSPFEFNYAHRPEFIRYPYKDLPYHDYIKNSYDNAVLYNDFLYDAVIGYLKARADGPVHLFITSDHGEEFGEEGRWGHDRLTCGSSLVPLLYYTIGGEPDFLNRLRSLHMPTHYELGLLIADRLGYTITDPNREEGWFYVGGVAAFGKSGYMKLRKSESEIPSELIVY
jgi:glucan phosphoethanolaminetransferase (alkaline phosphatase superfamily)